MGDSLTLATGVIEHIGGTVYEANGSPVMGALVELRAADHQGDSLYSTGAGRNAVCDANFEGFGRFLTGSTGRPRLRTIKTGLYSGCTTRVTTQTGWNEIAYSFTGQQWATQNNTDNVFCTVSSAQRSTMLPSCTPVAGGAAGEVAATRNYFSGQAPPDHSNPGDGGQFVAGKIGIVPGPSGDWGGGIAIPADTGFNFEFYTCTALGVVGSSQILLTSHNPVPGESPI